MTAEIKGTALPVFLQKLAGLTGWQVFIEPETRHVVSAKFKDRATGDGLKMLLGDLSYALVPQADGPNKLFIFQTSMQRATQMIAPLDEKASKEIPDELVVKLKPGADAEALAKSLGAKIIGSIDGKNLYRLKFDSADAAKAARSALSGNSDVASVESNYYMDRVYQRDGVNNAAKPLNLSPKPLGSGNPIIVGLIDTAVQPFGNSLDKFMLESVSVTGDSVKAGSEPGHGSAMAETVLRGLEAMMKDGNSTSVRLQSFDVFGNKEMANSFDVTAGVYDAIKAGVNVINMSMGSSDDSPAMREAVATATSSGILVVAAAGNEHTTQSTLPAAWPGVFAVTAIDRNGNIMDYANYGDFVKAGAPGTVVINYAGKSWAFTGTSVSSAYTAGLAAALAEKSGKSANDIYTALQKLLPVNKGAKLAP
jgi:hypothetical protein